MTRGRLLLLALAAFGAVTASPEARASESPHDRRIARIVDEAISPLMAEHDVPGMAVAVVVQGRRHVFNYGVAAKESGRPVNGDTIFEIGSVSKTFTATLGAYAAAGGALSLADAASRHMPALAGSRFDEISLLDLATYAAGGLPLQFPDAVVDRETMVEFYRDWRPAYPAGTRRLYSNTSIGLFGASVAASLGASFEALMATRLFPLLGLTRTFITVPPDRMKDYASGYARDGRPVRVTPGVLDAQAYGVKATASDMIRFVAANIDGSGLDETLRRAIEATQTGYYRVGPMVQGLGWEIYAYPTGLDRLLAGNSAEVIFQPNPVTRLEPPATPRADRLIDKTGSTNGFGAYVAFVPDRGIGVVMLANRNYPIPARVAAAYRILSALDGLPEAGRAD